MNLEPKLRNRMIFKVIVLGMKEALRNGFLNLAAGDCMSCQLQPALGVSLGVSRTRFEEGPDVALQLWSIPSSDRFAKLRNSFSKGHKAAIILLESDDIPHIGRLLSILPPETMTSTIFVTLSDDIAFDPREAIEEAVGTSLPIYDLISVDEIVSTLSRILSGFLNEHYQLPLVVRLPSDSCPALQPELGRIEKEPSSIVEIEEIRDICIELGVSFTEEECYIDLPEGIVTVGLSEGKTSIRPVLCEMCVETCKKDVSICIVGQDSGWSSGVLRRRALLTIAKIMGLKKRELPEHVEMQISRAALCSSFLPSPSIPESLISRTVNLVSSRRKSTRIPLLELAQQRMAEGRLSKSDFNMLKRKLEQLTNESE